MQPGGHIASGDVAQAELRDVQREGQSLGGAGVVVSPDVSHSGLSDLSSTGRSGEMPVQRHPPGPQIDRSSGAAAGLCDPVMREPESGQMKIDIDKLTDDETTAAQNLKWPTL